MKFSIYKQAGLSLVELMISITLGLVLMAGVVQMFVSSKTVFSTQQSLSRIQETGRLAIEFLSKDIRMAGFYGCFRPNPSINGKALQNSTLNISGLHGNFAQGIQGYQAEGSLTAAERTYIGKTLKASTNVLVLRSASATPRIINAVNTPLTLFVHSTQSIQDGCVDGLCINGAAVVSDCFRARLFQVSALSSAGNTLTVSHADSWAVATDPSVSFTSGEVLPMNTTTYFVSTGASGAPSLWQKVNGNLALEVLEGVEDVRYRYATSQNTTYRLAQAITAAEWADVTSVRVEVLVRSMENNVVPEAQPYTFDGVSVTLAANDRYMRQVFTATVALRSRAANF